MNLSNFLHSKLVALGVIAALTLAPFSQTGTINKTYAAFYLESTGQQALGFQEESAVQNTITAEMVTDLREKMLELDPAQWEVSQKMAAKSTENIVEWVNSGFDGDPAFVTDLDAYLDEKIDSEAEDFLRELEQTALDPEVKESFAQNLLENATFAKKAHAQTPFGDRITEAARAAFERMQSDEILQQPTIPDSAYDEFRAGNASIDTFFQAISSGQNLPVSRTLEALGELDRVVQETIERETTILNWGDGFRSFENCTSDGGGGEQCLITTPGNVISEMLNKSLGLGLDSLIASDEINQMVDLTFGRIGELALTMENGLAGLLDLGNLNLESLLAEFGLDDLDLDLNSVAGRLLDEMIEDLFADDGGNSTPPPPDIGVGLLELVEVALEIEEEYLALLEQAVEEGPDDLREQILEEDDEGNTLIDLSEENIALLEDTVDEVTDIQDSISLRPEQKNEQLLEITEEFYELQPDLARRSDVQILRNEMGL